MEFKKYLIKYFFHKIATGFEPLTFKLQAYASTYEKTFCLTKNIAYRGSVVETGDKPLLLKIYTNFRKNSITPELDNQGPGEN